MREEAGSILTREGEGPFFAIERASSFFRGRKMDFPLWKKWIFPLGKSEVMIPFLRLGFLLRRKGQVYFLH